MKCYTRAFYRALGRYQTHCRLPSKVWNCSTAFCATMNLAWAFEFDDYLRLSASVVKSRIEIALASNRGIFQCDRHAKWYM